MDTSIIGRDAKIQNFLEQKAAGDDIAAAVAKEALSQGAEHYEEFFTGLFKNGCVSGWV